MTTTKIENGTYFLHPEGSAWIAATFVAGRCVGQTEECNAATHAAANDQWADVVPSDKDVELSPEESLPIIRACMGDQTDPTMVVVCRA